MSRVPSFADLRRSVPSETFFTVRIAPAPEKHPNHVCWGFLHLTAFNRIVSTFPLWPDMAAHSSVAKSFSQHKSLHPPSQPPQGDPAAAAGRRGPADVFPRTTPPHPASPVPAGDAAFTKAPAAAPNVLSEAKLIAYSKENVKDLCKSCKVPSGGKIANVMERISNLSSQ